MKIRVNPGAASLAGSLLIKGMGLTWRVETRGLDHLDDARSLTGRVIYAFWHGRLLALTWAHRNRKIHVLASEHYDGDLMGRTIERIGYGHLKGSSTRGGARAVREMRKVLSDGYDIGLAVDGPRGPRGRVQQGATELSRLTSTPVIPVSATARGRKLLGSWDRFQVPLPFARIVVEYAEPVVVSGSAGADEREQKRLELERRLSELTSRLDRDMGYEGGEVWPHEDR